MEPLNAALLCAAPVLATGLAALAIRKRNLDRWLVPYLAQTLNQRARPR